MASANIPQLDENILLINNIESLLSEISHNQKMELIVYFYVHTLGGLHEEDVKGAEPIFSYLKEKWISIQKQNNDSWNLKRRLIIDNMEKQSSLAKDINKKVFSSVRENLIESIL